MHPNFPALSLAARTVRPRVLLAGYLAISLIMAPLNLSTWLMEQVYMPAYRLTHGLASPNLVVGPVGLALTLALICWPARLRLSDIGWKRSGVKSGAIAVFAIWAILQVVAVLTALASGAGLSLAPAWSTGDYSGIGRFLSQLFGTAPFEESLFRGLLTVQIFLLLSGRNPQHARRWVAVAILGSALAFSVPHVPNRIINESYTGVVSVLLDQAALIFAGSLFAWIYLTSGNLWLLIGFHALVNTPTAVFASPLDGNYQVILVLSALVVFLLPWSRRAIASRVAPGP